MEVAEFGDSQLPKHALHEVLIPLGKLDSVRFFLHKLRYCQSLWQKAKVQLGTA